MQYVLDIISEQRELFLHVRSVMLSFEQIKEVKNAKQTSYSDQYSTVCMIRVRKGKVHLSFANGASLSERFTTLKGEGKIVRYVDYSNMDDVDVPFLKELITESLMLNMEKYELRLLKCHMKSRNK